MHFHFPLCKAENCSYGLYKSNSQHNRATFPVSCSSQSVSLVFHESFLFFCSVSVAFCLIHLMLAIVNKLRKIFFFRSIFSCLGPFCPRGVVMNSKKIRFKGPNGSLQQNITGFSEQSQFYNKKLKILAKCG